MGGCSVACRLFDCATPLGIREMKVQPQSLSTIAGCVGLWLSLVERLPRVQEAAGSNPASPMVAATLRVEDFSVLPEWPFPTSI